MFRNFIKFCFSINLSDYYGTCSIRIIERIIQFTICHYRLFSITNAIFSNIKPIRRDLIEASENKMRQCIYETTVAGCCSRSRTEPVLDVAQKCFSTGYNNFNWHPDQTRVFSIGMFIRYLTSYEVSYPINEKWTLLVFLRNLKRFI